MVEESGAQTENTLPTPVSFDQLTPDQRKQYLDFLIARAIADAGKPVPTVQDQVDYRVYNFNPYPEDHAEYLREVQAVDQALGSNDKRKIEKVMRENPRVLEHTVKIHIQPVPEQMLAAVKDLGEVLAQNEAVRSALYAGKAMYKGLEQTTRESADVEPFVTLYLYPNVNREAVEQALVERFARYQKPEGWITPRYNRNVAGIVYTSRGEGRIKKLMQREGVLGTYYEPERNYSEPKEISPQQDTSLGQRLKGMLFRKR